LNAIHNILASNVETIDAFRTGFDTVNLLRLTVGDEVRHGDAHTMVQAVAKGLTMYFSSNYKARWRCTVRLSDNTAHMLAAKGDHRSVLNLTYADRVGAPNGDEDLLESIDGRSYNLQCRSACRTRQAEKCMGKGLLTQRSCPDRATRHPHLPPPPELRRPP